MSLVLAAAFTSAQDAQDKKEGQDAEATKTPKYFATLGLYDWGLSGNPHKLRQYATPATGLVLKDFYTQFGVPRGQAWLHAAGPGQEDYAYEGRMIFSNGKLSLDAYRMRNKFFDNTPTFIPHSQRDVEEVNGRLAVTDNIAVSGTYRREERSQSFEAPRDPRNDRNYLWNANIDANLKGGSASVGVTERRYYDRLNVYPDSKTKQVRFSFDHNIGPKLNVDGTIAQTKIEQGTAPEAQIDNWGLGGQFTLSDDTEIGFRTTREKSDIPQANRAWVRERFSTTANVYHSIGEWQLQAGYTRREHERVRGDLSFVDLSKWDIYEGRLTGHVNDWLKLNLKVKQQSLRKGAIMLTEDTRALYFDDRTTIQAKLDGSRGRTTGYGVYTQTYLENEPRDVKIRNHAYTFGGTYQLTDTMDVFGEYMNERSNVKSEVVDPFELKLFFPQSTTFSCGLNWATSQNTFLSIAFTEFATDNDNPLNLQDGNVHGRTLSTTLRHRASSGNEFSITVAPWRYNDKMFSQLGFRTTLIQLNASIRF